VVREGASLSSSTRARGNRYFARRGLDPEKLPAHTGNKFARLSPDDMKALDAVGEGLESDAADGPMYRFVIH